MEQILRSAQVLKHETEERTTEVSDTLQQETFDKNAKLRCSEAGDPSIDIAPDRQ